MSKVALIFSTVLLTSIAYAEFDFGDQAPRVRCEDASKTLQGCVESICGLSEKNKTYVDVYNDLNTSSPLKSEEDKNIMKSLKEALVDVNKNDLDNYKAVQNEIKDSAISPSIQGIAKAIYAISLFNVITDCEGCLVENDYEIDETNKFLKVKLNEKVALKELSKHQTKLTAAKNVALLKELIDQPLTKNMFYAGSSGYELFMKSKYPDLNLKESMLREINFVKNFRKELDEKNPYLSVMLNESLNVGNLENLFNQENLSSDMINTFFSASQVARLVSEYVKNPPAQIAAIDASRIGAFLNVKTLSTNAKKKIASLESEVKSQEKTNSELALCEAIYQKNIEALPDDTQKKTYEKFITELKASFKEKAINRLSTHTKNIINPQFDEIIFELPNSKNEFKVLFKSMIDDKKNDAKSTIANEMSNPKAKEAVLALLPSLAILSDKDEESTCKDFELQTLDDAAMRMSSGKFNTSLIALKSPRDAKGIVYHEMAHLLQTLMQNSEISSQSGKAFTTSLSCVSRAPFNAMAEQQIKTIRDGNNETNFVYMSSMFTDENYADLVSASLLDESDENFMCYLMPKEAGKYSNFKFGPGEELNDTHSPDFARLLSIEKVKSKQIPEACVQSLNPAVLLYLQGYDCKI